MLFELRTLSGMHLTFVQRMAKRVPQAYRNHSWRKTTSFIVSLALLLLMTLLMSSTSTTLGKTTSQHIARASLKADSVRTVQLASSRNSNAVYKPMGSIVAPNNKNIPAVPRTQDASLFLRPSIDTPGSCPAPANGGSTTTGCRFVLDLMLNTGSNSDATAQQSFLTFTYQLLENIRVDQIGSSCTFTSTVTGDLGTFDLEEQNRVCNGPGTCTFRGETVQPGYFSFASDSGTNCEQGCGGVFRVARVGLCAVSPGQAVFHWQLSPQAPPPHDTEIINLSGDPIHNAALFTDYTLTIVGDPLYSPTRTPTYTRTPTITPSSTPACGLVWRMVDPAPGGYTLKDIAAVAPTDIWAVGDVIEHWNGTQWSIIPDPPPSGYMSVAASASNDVWAVGGSPTAPLIKHWDGIQWSAVPVPDVGQESGLVSVVALSADDAWIVGFHNHYENLTLHWDGTQWSVVPSPNLEGYGSYLYDVTAIGPNDVWAVGLYYLWNSNVTWTLTMHWDGSEWSLFPSPNVQGITNALYGVAAVSANDVWAVGTSHYYSDHPLMEHWDGTQWSVVPSPNIIGDLYSVAAVSANDIWAVGYYYDNGRFPSLTEHWNGTQWIMVSNLNPLVLTGVSAVSSEDVWAVGNEVPKIEHFSDPCDISTPTPTGTITSTPLFSRIPSNTRTSTRTRTSTPTITLTPTITPTFTWTPVVTLTPTFTPGCGLTWNVVNGPNPGTSTTALYGVASISPNDAWAVGYIYAGSLYRTLTEHWDGTHWSVVPSPNQGTGHNYLQAVTALASNDVWAVGYMSATPDRTLILHWDGSTWSIVPTPNSTGGSNRLFGVTATSTNDVWAVGYACANNNCTGTGTQPLIEHWEGNAWTIAGSASYGSGWNHYLYAVTVVSAADVWATGYYNIFYGEAGASLIEHWNGNTWSIIPSPNPGTSTNSLYAIAGVAYNDVWAAGHYYVYNTNRWYTSIEHWNGSTWTTVSSPNVAGSNYLEGLAVVASNDVWAVGHSGDSPGRTLVLHWDGSAWSIVPSPNSNDSNGSNVLNAVAAGSSTNIWAVGSVGTWPLTLRYADPCSTATLTPTPTSTVPHLLVGHVRWQGRPPQPHALQQLPVTLTLKLGDNEVNFPPSTTDADGYFTYTMGALPAGTYSWRAMGPKYLANAGTVSLTYAPATTVEIGFMRAGDANNDNIVDTSDFAIVHASFGRAVGEPAYDDRADFTGNGVVTMLDYVLLKRNFGQWGAPPLRPSPPEQRNKIMLALDGAQPALTQTRTPTHTGTPTVTPTPTSICGLRWHLLSSPSVGTLQSVLAAAAVVAPNDIWAVGHYYEAGAGTRTLVEHWNGVEWSVVPSPNVINGTLGNSLNGVSAVSANDIWAVGASANESIGLALTMHWDGMQWTIVPGAATHRFDIHILYSVSAVSTNDVWAVGYYWLYEDESFIYRPLVEHWDGFSWSIISCPIPGLWANHLYAVSAVSANDVWAVSYFTHSVG